MTALQNPELRSRTRRGEPRFSDCSAVSAPDPSGCCCLTCKESWQVEATAHAHGGAGQHRDPGGAQNDHRQRPDACARRSRPKPAAPSRWRFLNSRLKNILKVLIGFIPAFATFALTKDWWLLAYGGAFIWFGITGLRNIVQSVLGGGGFRRSPLLNWNDYVSWTRITDSLMYTGFSVPLLDYLVKTVILDRGFGITTASHPLLLYTFMALANGIYLSEPQPAARPAQGGRLRQLLPQHGFDPGGGPHQHGRRRPSSPPAEPPRSPAVLQKWAAIISKTASDIVAGFIEGLADRHRNIQARLRDYKGKFEQLFDIYAQLELLYPDVQTFAVLQHSGQLKRKPSVEARDLEKIIMIHALDLLYFWMYQPRARTALRQFVHDPVRRRTPDPGELPVHPAAPPRDQPDVHRRDPRRQLPPAAVVLSVPERGVPGGHQGHRVRGELRRAHRRTRRRRSPGERKPTERGNASAPSNRDRRTEAPQRHTAFKR
ncbi:MAG: hypothetical protein MZV70_05155 [Desulfobacterales bacterium]|nr:hypothetical protein [Desulfobacterales bacterium]